MLISFCCVVTSTGIIIPINLLIHPNLSTVVAGPVKGSAALEVLKRHEQIPLTGLAMLKDGPAAVYVTAGGS